MSDFLANPYVLKKKLSCHLRKIKNVDSFLSTSLTTLTIDICSGKNKTYQEINLKGDKKFKKGVSVKDAHLKLTPIELAEKGSICICEGFATGVTICALTGIQVIVAFSASRMKSVIKESFIKSKKHLIICADNDTVGIKAAKEVKNLMDNSSIALPVKNNEDFNDEYVRTSKIDFNTYDIDDYTIFMQLNSLDSSYYTDYTKWILIGHVLRRGFKDDPELGLKIFKWFSKKSIKYNEENTTLKWWGFNAEEKGPNLSLLSDLSGIETECDEKNPYQLLTKKQLQNEISNWIFIYTEKIYYNLKNQLVIPKEAASDYFLNLEPKGNVHKTLLRHPLLKKVHLSTYLPGGDEIFEDDGKIYVNYWIKPKIVPVEGDITPFIEHIKYLGGEDWEKIMLFLSWCIQKPQQKIGYMLLLIGSQGIGKTYIEKIVRSIFGIGNVCSLTTLHIMEKYNKWVSSSQIVIVNELMSFGKERGPFYNYIKTMITEEFVPMREMRNDVAVERNFVNFITFSNYDNPIGLDSDDRRVLAIKCYKEKKPFSYYNELFNWTEENTNKILNYLLNLDISNVRIGDAPSTNLKESYITEFYSPESIKEFKLFLKKEGKFAFTTPVAVSFFGSTLDDPAIFGKMLSNHFQYLKRLRFNKQRHQVYCLKEYAQKCLKLTPSELREVCYQEQILKEGANLCLVE